MAEIKRVYMMTDLEGVAGIDAWDPRFEVYGREAQGIYERSEMQRLLTGEVNAAAAGLLAAGVDEILINDCHGAGRTILVEELISGVKMYRGLNRPMWLVGITPRFDAFVQVGMHAMSDTPNACLCHTMSTKVRAYRVNGKAVGEMELAAYLAGELGIPWIFTSGDAHACRESEAWMPGIVTAAVKEGASSNSAIHLAPVDARKLINEQIQAAVKKASVQKFEPLVASKPVTLEIEMREPGMNRMGPGMKLVNECTVRYRGSSFWSIFHNATYGREVPLPE